MNYEPDKSTTHFLESKEYTCDACGLISRPHDMCLSGFMHRKEERCLCSLCYTAQCLDNEVFGTKNHGYVFYMPGVEQEAINIIIHKCFASICASDSDAVTSQSIYDRILVDRTLIEKLSPSIEDGQVHKFVKQTALMIQCEPEAYKTFRERLVYIPKQHVFEQCYRFWVKASPNLFGAN